MISEAMRNPKKSAAQMNFQRVCSYSVERIPACSSQGYSVDQFSSLPVFQSRRHPQLPAAPTYHDFPACHQTPEPKERDRHLKQARLIQVEVTRELCSPRSSTKPFHSRQQTWGCCEPKGKSSCQPSPSQEHLSLHPRRLTPAGRRKNKGFRKKPPKPCFSPMEQSKIKSVKHIQGKGCLTATPSHAKRGNSKENWW